MTDEIFRKQQRDYFEGSLEKVKYLRSAIKNGKLSLHLVSLAAYLGDEASLMLTDPWDDRFQRTRPGYEVCHVLEFGIPSRKRAFYGAIAADFAERVLPVFENWWPGNNLPRMAIEKSRAALAGRGRRVVDVFRIQDQLSNLTTDEMPNRFYQLSVHRDPDLEDEAWEDEQAATFAASAARLVAEISHNNFPRVAVLTAAVASRALNAILDAEDYEQEIIWQEQYLINRLLHV